MVRKSKINYNLKKLRLAASFTARLFLGTVVVVSAAFLVLMLRDSKTPLFHLKEIHYEGFHHSTPQELDGRLKATFFKNSLRIDLDHFREVVETEKWVKSAVVRRRLPDQMFVYVTEREPVAAATLNNELQVVDAEGIVLAPYSGEYDFIDRPIVSGLTSLELEDARADNAQRMEAYLRLLEELNTPQRDYTRSISEVNVENPGRVAVIPVEDAVPVFLGDSHFLERYQAFLSRIELFREVKEQHGVIESVDVTYDNKIIIHTAKNQQTRKSIDLEKSS